VPDVIPAPRRRLAVCDLGSNSFRLVVFTAVDGWWRRTDEIYQPVRIGEGMAATGELGTAPMKRALDTITVFSHFCAASGLQPDEIDAVATSAIRDASNQDAFLAKVSKKGGMDIRVLSREEEARYGYLAAVNSTTLADGAVLDIGGGSMQLVGVTGRHAVHTASWPLGAVRMTERFLDDDGPASGKQLDKLRAHVAGKLEKHDWIGRTGRRLVGVGGTVRNLAVAAQRLADLPTGGVQGHVVERETVDALVERIAALPRGERSSVPGVKPARADVILAGLVVIQSVMEVGDFPAIEATEAGLREGVFFSRFLEDRGDPPLFEDVRSASVLNLAAQYGVDPAHTAHVATLALGLFDDLAAAGLHPGDAMERELLWAASTLHDIGVAVDYDDHHKHTRYLVLNAGLPGFTPREVAIVAQAARYHRKGMPDPGPLAAYFEKGDEQVLDRCSVLLRLAEDLERSRDQAVRAVGVEVDDERVRLTLDALDDVSVPRWAARRENPLFARAYGRELEVA
jgi:exopolyphosphatase / guanosine-5'-triphosphate,3'-diphosphate pyrophosphatase